MIRDGARLTGALVLLVALFIGGAAVSLYQNLTAEGTFAPLTVSDVTMNSRIEGIEGPAVQAGSHYNGTITLCNNSDEPQVITFVIQLERLTGPVHFVNFGSVEFPLDPGCATVTGDSAPLPSAVAFGLWRESSAATATKGQHRQTVSFVSESFRVVP